MDRQALIERYRQGPFEVEAALEGITPEELDRVPEPGEWSPRMVVHHLADGETMSYIRLRRLLTEDNPLIQGYDQDHYARVLHYDRPVEQSLAVLRSVREATAELLERLGPEEWGRKGVHGDTGEEYTLDRWLTIYARHAHDHADQIRRARGA